MRDRIKKETGYSGAPYNFVPFDRKILERYPEKQALPAHDRFIPGLNTGEILCTLTAVTPVFIGNGGDREQVDFYRGANGTYLIPGSTVRGMTRTNMQILGYGAVRPGEDLEDYTLMFRALTNGANRNSYRSVLGIRSEKDETGKSCSVAEHVRAGYLVWEKDRYIIRPALENRFYSVSRQEPAARKWQRQYCFIDTVWYQPAAQGATVQISTQAQPGFLQGKIIGSGRMQGQKHFYVFPAADPAAEAIPVPEADVISYRADFEAKANQLGENRDFWKLPAPGAAAKPVFYIRYNGRLYWGMTQYLRIFYSHSIGEGLPQTHLNRAGRMVLDYAHAVLGYAEKGDCYRSRVSFGDFPVQDDSRPEEAVRVLLARPKPSSCPDYLLDGKTYQDSEFTLRGFKQYWFKCVQPSENPEKEKAAAVMRPMPAGTRFTGKIRFHNLADDELGLLLWSLCLEEGCCQSVGMGKPYGYGCVKVTIDRLLIFDLQTRYTPEAFLKGDPAAFDRTDAIRSHYIAAYHHYVTKMPGFKKNTSLPEEPRIQDFLYLHRQFAETPEAAAQFRYMEIGDAAKGRRNEYRSRAGALPTVRVYRQAVQESKPAEQPESAQPSQPSQAMDDALRALLARNNRLTRPPKPKRK